MAVEWRVIGPPGCGKTTHLVGVVEATARKYGPESVLVTSFTRAAARELASRVELPDDRIGTMHAHAWHALGRPEIAEAHAKEWNQGPGADTSYALSGGGGNSSRMDDDGVEEEGREAGDLFLRETNLRRARLEPEHLWPPAVREWWSLWQAWKGDTGFLDFTDLLTIAEREQPTAPGNPLVFFGDEAQDWSPLEFRLVRRWASSCELGSYLAADPAQAIYSFKGADPRLFHDPPIPDDHYRYLGQSRRLARAVHTCAKDWIARSSTDRVVDFAPTERTGRVVDLSRESGLLDGACSSRPEGIIEHIAADASKNGRTWMVLASCAYQLGPTLAVLRRMGVPFHNPYRATNGAWNPMRGAVERLRDFLEPIRPDLFGADRANTKPRLWTWQELERWSEMLPADKVFVRGGRTEVNARTSDDKKAKREVELTRTEVARLFKPDVVQAFSREFVGATPWRWLIPRLATKWAGRADMALSICEQHGARALIDKPKIVVGTCHSVKGAEADGVVLFPDLSPAGVEQWERPGPSRDVVRRIFYVGMTRARDDLFLAAPTRSHPALEWSQ